MNHPTTGAVHQAAVLAACACFALLAAAAGTAEQNNRDPLQPPAAARPAPLAADGSMAAALAPSVPRHVMVVDGTRYLIDHGRRRKVGDALGEGRIERLDESAVYVRQAGTLLRLPLYGAVSKRPVAEAATAAAAPSMRPAKPNFERPALQRPVPPSRPSGPGETP